MGLDMHLEKRTYVKNWEHHSPEERHNITIKKGGKKHPHIKPDRVSNIVEEVAYWRKANHIHKWFVDNVQDGQDDCRDYYVDREQLKELVDLCKQVNEIIKKAPKKTIQIVTGWQGGKEIKGDHEVYDITSTEIEELLPTQSGFFFGGTEYDDWYIKDNENTIKMLEPLLEEEGGDFYYSSSW